MHTPEGFRSLTSMLLDARAPNEDEPAIAIVEEIVEGDTTAETHEHAITQAEMLRDIRLFRARIIEAVEDAVETLAGDIAAEVLGRELQLACVDLETILDRQLQRYFADEPLRIRLHPDDAANTSCALPVVADENLRTGDAVIELRCGSVDATLGVRLAAVVKAVCA